MIVLSIIIHRLHKNVHMECLNALPATLLTPMAFAMLCAWFPLARLRRRQSPAFFANSVEQALRMLHGRAGGWLHQKPVKHFFVALPLPVIPLRSYSISILDGDTST